MQTVAEVKYFASGFLFSRVWTLQAFDPYGRLIVQISKDYGPLGNSAKFADFLVELSNRNYKLTKAQIDEVSEVLSLNLAGIFNRVTEIAPTVMTLYSAVSG